MTAIKIKQPTEAQIQKTLIERCSYHPILSRFLIRIKNESNKRSKQITLKDGKVKYVNFEAINDKKMGVKKGVSDLFLAYPSGGFHGMWIELKRSRLLSGALTKEQREWQSAMRELGYKAIVCHREQDAYDELIAYLKLNDVTECKTCKSHRFKKNGHTEGKRVQRYLCLDCGVSF
jgi:hypothetical protein